MSVKVSSWVWHEAPQSIGGNDLIVLLALADIANDSGDCVFVKSKEDATQEALAKKSRVSRRTFQRSIDRLLSLGVVAVERGAQHVPNEYRVLIQGGQIDASSNSRGVNLDVQGGQFEHSDAPTVARHRDVVRKNVVNALFDEFWSVYPRHVGKDAARRKFETVVKSTDGRVVVEGARRFSADQVGTDPKFIPHPATWLNAGRWDDESDEEAAVMESIEENVTQIRLAREMAEAKAKWLAEHGITEAEYEANRGNPAWLAGLEARRG